jgi:hypothetical protein
MFALNVRSRDVEPMFEVFSLEIVSVEELIQRVRFLRSEAELRNDLPELIRNAWANAAMPAPPSSFEPWPFDLWRLQILKRVEFIIEDVEVQHAIGQGPHNSQSAALPGQAPPEASASCDVSVGLLFTASDESQLLIAADWRPFAKTISTDPGEIGRFVETCEAADAADAGVH